VYILDTGIRVTHEDFEGRASWGATFGGYEVHDRISYLSNWDADSCLYRTLTETAMERTVLVP